MDSLTTTKTSVAAKIGILVLAFGGVSAVTGIALGLIQIRKPAASRPASGGDANTAQVVGAQPFTPMFISNVRNNTPPISNENRLRFEFQRSGILLGYLFSLEATFQSGGYIDPPLDSTNPLEIKIYNVNQSTLIDMQFRTLTIEGDESLVVCLPAERIPDFSIKTYYIGADGTAYVDQALTQSALSRPCRERNPTNQITPE